jgi:hypothetical protein
MIKLHMPCKHWKKADKPLREDKSGLKARSITRNREILSEKSKLKGKYNNSTFV